MLKTIVLLYFLCCAECMNAQLLKDSAAILKMQAPETFKAEFKTTQGSFIVEVYRSWSPKAADRLYQLISTGSFNNDIIFRATFKYVQFGINNDSTINSFWDNHSLPDEPVTGSNTDSIISFARGGPNTRSEQIFINMQNNQRLDRANGFGFPPVGKVIKGMDIVRNFNTQYGDAITFNYQDSIYIKGNQFLETRFPGLDRIISANIPDAQ